MNLATKLYGQVRFKMCFGREVICTTGLITNKNLEVQELQELPSSFEKSGRRAQNQEN